MMRSLEDISDVELKIIDIAIQGNEGFSSKVFKDVFISRCIEL